ncbi:hypothetical protein ASPVEDRAFT_149236 [Aspergillus versicolor CBS 583.65]|uniref:Uncharacterized protein n=1 Tax=Aspergillus versicolor CBS 583.65 TaxID=1036611 RepID=A0A1L9PFF8_ASPVE|nr:uncharacterized protein ASPVEDRAFT_149236 [Aspergillus versicolor CBS 583.65]OJJ00271.1 hypothetical protein ASPVEDRAFT_149236 [Aspergillus versicolor CBS 583.65]
MKVTRILASLAVASTTAAAAVPANLDVTQIQSTVSHLDTVLTNLDGAAKSGTISKADLADSSDQLSGIHDLLNNLVGTIVGGVDSSELLQGALDLVGGVVTVVINALSYTDQVPDFGFLSESLVTRIQNGEVDKEGLEGILTVVGGKDGLAALNKVLEQGK